MNLIFQRKSKHFVKPFLATSGSAGYDLTAVESVVIPPKHSEGVWMNLGFAAAIPDGYVALLLPRSGKGCKQGLSLNNTVGVIDSDFRDEWRACLRCNNDEPIEIEQGQCYLQVVFHKVEHFNFVESSELPEAREIHAGFGSTDRPRNSAQMEFDFRFK